MLGYLLAMSMLGHIPGTNINITFDQLLFVACLAYLRYFEKKNHKELMRMKRRIVYRCGVISRRYKRRIRSYLRSKQYRLAVTKRRYQRKATSYFRRHYRTIVHFFVMDWRRSKRETKRSFKSAYRTLHFHTVIRSRRAKRRLYSKVRRTKRNVIYAIQKAYRRRLRKLSRSYRPISQRVAATKLVRMLVLIKNFGSQEA